MPVMEKGAGLVPVNSLMFLSSSAQQAQRVRQQETAMAAKYPIGVGSPMLWLSLS
jgi:hypothetical protein